MPCITGACRGSLRRGLRWCNANARRNVDRYLYSQTSTIHPPRRRGGSVHRVCQVLRQCGRVVGCCLVVHGARGRICTGPACVPTSTTGEGGRQQCQLRQLYASVGTSFTVVTLRSAANVVRSGTFRRCTQCTHCTLRRRRRP